MTIREKIIRKAIEILENRPTGIRYAEFVRQIKNALPETAENTIRGTIWNLEVRVPESVFKPDRGVFLHTKYRGTTEPVEAKTVQPARQKFQEKDFYKPFADWLVKELEECTKAIPIGGNLFRDKWGTPDVIGIKEPKKSDIIKLPTEIVSAEIKLDSTNLITAFGQACAYRLFSHKSYIVVPTNSPEDDIARLDALSRIFGVGLILFEPDDPKNTDFSIRSRASKHDPDMFYVNRYMRIIEDQLFG
jgi:hypothetical protein